MTQCARNIQRRQSHTHVHSPCSQCTGIMPGAAQRASITRRARDTQRRHSHTHHCSLAPRTCSLQTWEEWGVHHARAGECRQPLHACHSPDALHSSCQSPSHHQRGGHSPVGVELLRVCPGGFHVLDSAVLKGLGWGRGGVRSPAL